MRGSGLEDVSDVRRRVCGLMVSEVGSVREWVYVSVVL